MSAASTSSTASTAKSKSSRADAFSLNGTAKPSYLARFSSSARNAGQALVDRSARSRKLYRLEARAIVIPRICRRESAAEILAWMTGESLLTAPPGVSSDLHARAKALPKSSSGARPGETPHQQRNSDNQFCSLSLLLRYISGIRPRGPDARVVCLRLAWPATSRGATHRHVRSGPNETQAIWLAVAGLRPVRQAVCRWLRAHPSGGQVSG